MLNQPYGGSGKTADALQMGALGVRRQPPAGEGLGVNGKMVNGGAELDQNRPNFVN